MQWIYIGNLMGTHRGPKKKKNKNPNHFTFILLRSPLNFTHMKVQLQARHMG